MSALFRLASLIRNLFRRSRVEREMDAELGSFVQMLADDNVRSGMSPEAARRAALVEVRGVEQVKEEARAARAGALLDTIARDLRFGARMLLKHPVLSLSAILTFGLGIGLNTTAFSMIDAVYFQSPPFERVDRLIKLEIVAQTGDATLHGVDVHDFLDFREQQAVFEDLVAYSRGSVNLATGAGEPERLSGGFVSAGAFEQLRIRPILGRTFRAGEDRPGAEPVIVIGHELWRDRFGSSPGVLGRTVVANGVRRIVIGVMPERFGFPKAEQLWLPVTIDPSLSQRGQGPWYQALGRLKDGVSLEQAEAQMAAIGARLERDHPEAGRTLRTSVQPLMGGRFGPEENAVLLAMLGAVAGVLLIACANVANLLLARASARTREVGIRTALGASRGRVIAQLVTEVMILAMGGGALGLSIGWIGIRWIDWALRNNSPPYWVTFGLDHRILLFAFGATVVSGVVSSLVPAIRTSKTDVAVALKDENRGASGLRMGRFSSALVVAEVAVSCALLVASGLMIASVARMRSAALPFATDDVLTASVFLPGHEYPDSAARAVFREMLLPRLAAIPGVDAATLTLGLPGQQAERRAFAVEGRQYVADADFPVSRVAAVGPGYFETFQAMVLRGREFRAGDRRGALPVALVNESFARRHFSDGEALGRHIRLGRRDTTAQWLTVVGVVPDMYMQGMDSPSADPSGFYVPIAQSRTGSVVSFALRARGEPTARISDARAAVRSLDPDLPIFDVMTMDDALWRETWHYHLFGTLFTAFGVAALFLASVGMYGVMSFAVTRRTHEMGVRMAMGADGPQLVWLVLRRGIVLLASGLGIGLALAALLATPLQGVLFGVRAHDPVVFGTVVASLALVGLAATLVPANRVTRVNPAAALGSE